MKIELPFVKGLMNGPTSHLASRGPSGGVVQNGRFLQEGEWGKKVISRSKERIVPGKVSFP